MREHGKSAAHVLTGTPADLGWVSETIMDPEEEAKFRRHQVAYLAFHGKQSMLAWDDLPLRVLDRCYAAMGEQMERVRESLAME